MTTSTPRLRLVIQNILSKPIPDLEKTGLLVDACIAWGQTVEGMTTSALAGYEAGVQRGRHGDGNQ